MRRVERWHPRTRASSAGAAAALAVTLAVGCSAGDDDASGGTGSEAAITHDELREAASTLSSSENRAEVRDRFGVSYHVATRSNDGHVAVGVEEVEPDPELVEYFGAQVPGVPLLVEEGPPTGNAD